MTALAGLADIIIPPHPPPPDAGRPPRRNVLVQGDREAFPCDLRCSAKPIVDETLENKTRRWLVVDQVDPGRQIRKSAEPAQQLFRRGQFSKAFVVTFAMSDQISTRSVATAAGPVFRLLRTIRAAVGIRFVVMRAVCSMPGVHAEMEDDHQGDEPISDGQIAGNTEDTDRRHTGDDDRQGGPDDPRNSQGAARADRRWVHSDLLLLTDQSTVSSVIVMEGRPGGQSHSPGEPTRTLAGPLSATPAFTPI